MANLTLFAGDRIVVPKSELRFAQHHAIFDGEGGFYENKAGTGVVRTPIAEFFNGVTSVTEIRRFMGSDRQIREALSRAESLIGKSYNLVQFNCEHYADFIQYGQARSKQVDNVFGAIGIGLLFWSGYQLTKWAE
jgi:hypothetical protein